MNAKQSMFVTEYLTDLNATQAAIRAGYSKRTAYSIGQRLLKNVEVQNAIEQAMSERQSKLIASREQRQEFWTAIMRDESEDMKHRLRASELLAKSENDFTEHIKAEVQVTDYDLSKLSEDELVQLREILSKAKSDEKTPNTSRN